MSAPDEKAVEKMVHEMGFSRTEVNMALKDTLGNVDKAVEKLLSGNYAPPPYMTGGNNAFLPPSYSKENVDDKKQNKLYPSMSNPFSNLTKKGKSPDFILEDPSAPPLFNNTVGDSPDFNLNVLPPPYEAMPKDRKIKDWEVNMNLVYFNESNEQQNEPSTFTPVTDKSERCPVCFNAVGEQQVVFHQSKLFHHACFTRKHGPKCAYCCFPLEQADKDHELSGKYLVYKAKDYHVECYEKYAGPRCNFCFNVIIEKPNGEFSGNRVVDNNQEFHVECLQKKLYAAWRAKHS